MEMGQQPSSAKVIKVQVAPASPEMTVGLDELTQQTTDQIEEARRQLEQER